ncbi:oocyte-secreted protein 3 [Diceros bicornis minor]|uniref:oocyte-secreted protein 3 n=1 Tax=Diceros bicornis minor TaxID=77932 RepID=UPI0026ECAA72|nr:oocyte-secreted protein 3 [Diceros bicornis minor]
MLGGVVKCICPSSVINQEEDLKAVVQFCPFRDLPSDLAGPQPSGYLKTGLLSADPTEVQLQPAVSVGCTSSMFWAVVEPTLLGQGHFLNSDEVSLGIGCPVTNITSRGYEFNYLVTECGIQREVFSYGVIFYSALHYNIINKGVTGKIPLMCVVSSSSFLDDTSSTTNHNLTKSQNDLPSDNSCSFWNLSNTCLFGLPWIPYFQDSWAKPSHQSLLLKLPHSLVHESANMATF